MMLKSSTKSVEDLIFYANSTKHVVNGMKQLKCLKNSTELILRTLISLWLNTLKALDQLMMLFVTSFSVRLIRQKYLACFVLLVCLIAFKYLFKHKKSQNSINGGLNILKLKVLFRKHLVSIDLQMIMAQLSDFYVQMEIYLVH